MDTKQLQNLIRSVSDTDLQVVVAHPEWEAAYEYVKERASLPFDEDDVSEVVAFLHIMQSLSFRLDSKGRITCEQYSNDDSVWIGGEWVDVTELEEEEEEKNQ